MSCTVEQRRREIGIRAALGANQRRILGAIFARATGQLGTGAAAGAGLALLIEKAEGDLMAGQGLVFLPVVAGVMIMVGIAAAWVPARRGLRIHPIETPRAD